MSYKYEKIDLLRGIPGMLKMINLAQVGNMSQHYDNHADKIPLESLMLNPIPVVIGNGKNHFELLNPISTWETQLCLYSVKTIVCLQIDTSLLSEEKITALNEYVYFFLGAKSGAISFERFVERYIQSPHLQGFIEEHHSRHGEKLTPKRLCSLLGESAKSFVTFNRIKADIIDASSPTVDKNIPKISRTYPERWNVYAKTKGIHDADKLSNQLGKIKPEYPGYFKKRVNDNSVVLDALWTDLKKVIGYE